jgi:H+/Cl- antiporter ClcA
MSKNQRTLSSKTIFQLQFFFRRFPALPYILKWLCISIIIGALVGTASAGFLQSLEWATNFRENHIWLIAFLPMAGFLVGLFIIISEKMLKQEITF